MNKKMKSSTSMGYDMKIYKNKMADEVFLKKCKTKY